MLHKWYIHKTGTAGPRCRQKKNTIFSSVFWMSKDWRLFSDPPSCGVHGDHHWSIFHSQVKRLESLWKVRPLSFEWTFRPPTDFRLTSSLCWRPETDFQRWIFQSFARFFSGRFAVFFASPGSKNTWGRWTMDEKLSEQLGFWGPYEIKGIPVSHRQFWGTLRQAGSTLWLNQLGINNLQYWASQAAKRLQHISTSSWVKILCWMPVKQSSIFGVQTCSSLY